MWRAAALALLLATPALAANRVATKSARFAAPTTRYGHGILGDAIEYGALVLTLRSGRKITLTLPKSRVFEDISPRLADVNGDGRPEVIVIETSLTLGSSYAIYDETGKIAATPFLGRPYRWLAPVGVADLDGDGRVEIAYVEKPHLRKVLKVWRFEGGKLRFLAKLSGLSNHRIGQNFISGSIRDCGQGAEIITANGDWSKVMATRFDGRTLKSRALGPYKGRFSLKSALDCRL